MKLSILACAACLLVVGCSAKQQPQPKQQRQTEKRLPQCLSLCANQFAACTEEYPGDASACLPGRRDCQTTCEGEAAIKRMEKGKKPHTVDRIELQRPDAGTPDSGSQAAD